jgi:hypothetical protein
MARPYFAPGSGAARSFSSATGRAAPSTRPAAPPDDDADDHAASAAFHAQKAASHASAAAAHAQAIRDGVPSDDGGDGDGRKVADLDDDGM